MKFSSAVLLALASYAVADTVTCSSSQQCPEDKPCCSLYGECGTGSYCLGPCNPKFSYNLTSCAPAPICKSGDHQFTTTDKIISNSKYLGDANKYDFVVNNDIVSYDNSVLLTMANGSTGTVLTSTRAVWYGKVSATLKTSRTQGVVSSFILMSGVRDEIDYEFIGSFLETAQTNYYWQENLDYTHSRNISLSDTFENFHTYEIDWTPDSITWSVDGQAGRVLKRDDTWNATTKRYDFPQTPSFLQVSLWPGGLASNAEGTRNWAGGYVDWNAEDLKDPGYFYVTLKDISINCYDPPANTPSDGSNSYVYTDIAGLSSNVKISGEGTVLGSFSAVGFNMDKGSDNNIAEVSGSVPTGMGSGNNHSADDSSLIPTASVISISSAKKSTSSQSLADVTGTVSTTKQTSTKSVSVQDAKATSSAQATGASSADSSSAAAATTSAAGGFQQSSESKTSAAAANGAVKVFASIFALGASALAAVLVI
jgi:beta-glucanase (GH16 family)